MLGEKDRTNKESTANWSKIIFIIILALLGLDICYHKTGFPRYSRGLRS